ncbi:IclR family transcriptional regulator C-terminal domain-containing protein [Corynebacterium sp. MSK297]|uniref:IclR family transcriptional regulator domain-containing protein n=1 Tax=Corynebacterium sp. MSK297 TaxID=3050221 RepID=UPI00254D7D4C|nr:IclR family transcriptional regulator C-terminal domain-containing protein [Corynebacterium sp. MSK297]MDK8846117.1 IclR family transcriptional regulator C-terminal domain-containing protein [Corynebacterium sp. MSK297]
MSDTQIVQSLTRGLAVIKSFSGERPRQTLSQVATHTGLARATVRRSLHTLISCGYASTDGVEFWLTPKILELGYAYLSSLGLPALAQPHLEALSRRIDESCSLSVLEGADIVYIARTAVRRIMSANITIGTRFPAYATSMGRVLLAHLPRTQLDAYLRDTPLTAITERTITDPALLRKELKTIREEGWCIVNQELDVGLRSMAAPIYDAHGTVIGAVNISTQIANHDEHSLHENLLPALLDCCEDISSDLEASQNF